MALLKNEIRDLMGVVGSHVGCQDERLRLYLERKAERLVQPWADGAEGGVKQEC